MTQWSTLAPEGGNPARKKVSRTGFVACLRTGLSSTTHYMPLVKCAASDQPPAFIAREVGTSDRIVGNFNTNCPHFRHRERQYRLPHRAKARCLRRKVYGFQRPVY